MPPKPQRAPSEILISLASSVPPATFINLVTKQFSTSLDCLPKAQRSNIASILEAIQEDHEKATKWTSAVDHDSMSASLQKDIKALKKSVRNDWKCGYEEQSEMMSEIAGKIASWLQPLWTIGVENGVELTLIHKCLMLCKETINEIIDCGSRTVEVIDDCMDVTIKDNSGNEVYHEEYAGVSRSIGWVWRELLLVGLAQGKDKAVNTMIGDIKRNKILKEVEQLLPDGNETKNIDGYSLHIDHWSKKTRKNADQMKKLIHST